MDCEAQNSFEGSSKESELSLEKRTNQTNAAFSFKRSRCHPYFSEVDDRNISEDEKNILIVEKITQLDDKDISMHDRKYLDEKREKIKQVFGGDYYLLLNAENKNK